MKLSKHITVRLNEADQKQLMEYASTYNASTGELLRLALREKMADWAETGIPCKKFRAPRRRKTHE